MNTVTALLSFGLLVGCQDSGIKSDEIAAVTKGYLFIDNWGNSCGSGGLVVVINNDSYLAINAVPAVYEGTSQNPIPVWIRYERTSPDTCTQLANRIKILSIRKRK